MTKIIRTTKQLEEIDEIVGGAYKRNKELEKTKFGYAYKRFAEKNLYPVMKDLAEKYVDLRLQYAMEDNKTKEVITDPTSNRGFKYTKSDLQKLIEEERKARTEYEEREIEVEPYISNLTPDDFDESEIEMMQGLVFPSAE